MEKQVLRTPLCERLGIEYPICLAGMGGRGNATPPRLVAAVLCLHIGGFLFGYLAGRTLLIEERAKKHYHPNYMLLLVLRLTIHIHQIL